MKKIISVIAAVVMLSSTNTYAADFYDISGHWAESVINKLAERNIVSGVDDNYFSPDGAVTRGEFLKMIMNTVGIEPYDNQSCLDAKNNDWFSGYLMSALDKGLIPKDMIANYAAKMIEMDDANSVIYYGQFNGNIAITREEMAFMSMGMYQYTLNANTMKKLNEPTELVFTDKDTISRWAVSGVKMAVANGIIDGMDNKTFMPKSTTTRAQAATVISRLIDRIENK